MPMAGEGDRFFTMRPDTENFIQADRHENSNAAGGEIHKKHLPGRAKFKRVLDERTEFLSELGFLNVCCAITDEFQPTRFRSRG